MFLSHWPVQSARDKAICQAGNTQRGDVPTGNESPELKVYIILSIYVSWDEATSLDSADITGAMSFLAGVESHQTSRKDM
jgi:hypothetical protein